MDSLIKAIILAGSVAASLFGCAEQDELASANALGLAGLETVMQEELTSRGLPSIAVTVMQGGEVIFDQALGFADRENGIQATTDTSYALASVSKIFTGVAIMTLVEAGHLDLDAPIDEYLGEQKLQVHVGDAREVTVRRVANHTAGLPLHYHFFYSDQAARRPPMDETIRKFGHVVAVPGERFDYSNLGYGLLDYVVERSSGKTYGEYLQESVFEPLDMTSSGTTTELAGLPQVAVPYGGHNKPLAPYDFDHRGASAVFTSTRDLARFGTWFLGQEGILSAAARAEMTEVQPVPEEEGESTYGLGINVRRAGDELVFSHSGNMPGVSATLTMWPERDTVVAVAINSSVEGSLEALGRRVKVAGVLSRGGSLDDAPSAEATPPGPPTGPAEALPESMIGAWDGAIQTDLGPTRLRLVLEGDGTMSARVEGGEPQPVQPYGVSNGMYLLALPTIQIATPEAQRYPHGVLLKLVPRSDHLSGSATAFGAPGVFPMGSALSYWVDLSRSSSTGAEGES